MRYATNQHEYQEVQEDVDQAKQPRESLDPFTHTGSIDSNPSGRAYKEAKKSKLETLKNPSKPNPDQDQCNLKSALTSKQAAGQDQKEEHYGRRHEQFFLMMKRKIATNSDTFFNLKSLNRLNCSNTVQIAAVFIQRWWRRR